MSSSFHTETCISLPFLATSQAFDFGFLLSVLLGRLD